MLQVRFWGMSTEKNWKDLFFKKHSDNGYHQEEIEQLYVYDMELQAFFDFGGIMPSCLKLQNKIRDEGKTKQLTFFWKSYSTEANCPFCGKTSHKRCKDYFTKPVQDIPQDNLTVYHEVTLQRYFCENSDCEYERFVERFPEFSEENARKTLRFKKHCIERALGSSCKHAEAELQAEGAVVSHDMIMEYLKAEGALKVDENLKRNDVKVLSVDDINLRKGDKSSGCTVFIDAETHKTLIIVRGTTKEEVKKVMGKFKSAEFLSRDRASAYSSAGKDFGMTQVADRFHLIKNAHDVIGDTLMSEMPARIFIRTGDGWIQEEGKEVGEKVRFHVPEHIVENKIKQAGLSDSKAKKYRDTLKMLELSDKGLRSADIAHELGESLEYVRKLRRSAVNTLENVKDRIVKRLEYINTDGKVSQKVPGIRAKKTVAGSGVRPSKESIVEPYRQTVIEMWKAGGNHRTIHPVITKQGYTGSANAIYQFILKVAKEEPENMILKTKKQLAPKPWEKDFNPALAESLPNLSLEMLPRDKVYRNILKEASETRTESNGDEPGKEKPVPKTYETSRTKYSKETWELIHGADLKEEDRISDEEKDKILQKKKK
jgi:transposase